MGKALMDPPERIMNGYKIYIVCGGTGGHLAPGIAVAQGLMKRGHKVSLIISRKEVDGRLIRDYPAIPWQVVDSAPLVFKPLFLVRFFYSQTRGLLSCLSWFRREKPDLVMAFGGYTSFGVVMSASFLGIPVVLHEANRKVGRAIRFLKRFAHRIYLPPGIRLKGVSPRRIRHYGFPVRDEIRKTSREAALRKLGLKPGGKWLMVIGGSQGATSLNQWVNENFESLAAEEINVYCLTGLGKGSRGSIEAKTSSGKKAQAIFAPFSNDMGTLISAADLVISRAGAGTMAELIRCRKPGILVPYPYAADNHQVANARFLEQQGGCIVVNSKNMGTLREEVMDLIFNDWLLEKIRENLNHLDERDARDLIVRDIEKILKTSGSENVRRLSQSSIPEAGIW